MDITWLGHSCFRIRGREVAIVTDPYDRGAGYPPLRTTADIVSVSHDDPNHAAIRAVGSSDRPPRVVDSPGEYEIAGAMITAVRTYRDANHGATAGRNTSYLFEVDDIAVCHLGGLGHTLSAEQVEALQSVDVLLVPVDGAATLDAAKAAEVVSQLEPRVVIPMLHASAANASERVARFCREMGAAEATPIARYSVTKSSLPDETQVVILTPPEARR